MFLINPPCDHNNCTTYTSQQSYSTILHIAPYSNQREAEKIGDIELVIDDISLRLINSQFVGFRQFNSRNTSGDSFYVRAHLQYNANKEGALTFNMGDILHVTDTLPGGKDREGCYLASRVNDARKDMEAGLIPNHARYIEIRIKESRPFLPSPSGRIKV